ncbi:uncharacterized protein LOC115324051 [Ixodes scapularis]|uniref:uncharacterized protein LOC115324051 n=1 Tax=Ixodes scapularis TaxID=6945 RepID=UPI001A9F9725|nr:uncharacterized protein LOC115324051 [Ixodes scapularis]
MPKDDDTEDLCLHCKTSIRKEDSVLECNECHSKYHLGPCSGVTEIALRGKRPGFKELWKCQTCKGARLRLQSTPEGGQPSHEKLDVQQQLTQIMSMLSVLAPLKQQVDELVTMKQTVMDIEKSVQSMSDSYDELLKKVKDHDSEIKDLKKRVSELENEKKNDETNQLKKEINKLEQYGRRNNLEVHGLAESLNENLLEKLNKIADQIEVPRLTTHNVEAVHRIPTKTKKTPMVIVRFINRNDRDAWLKNKQKLRSGAEVDNVYLEENLTASNRKLFFDVRTKAKHLGYKFIWHKEGCSYVRKREGDPTLRIENESDLAKIE